ncbi:MAG TPA: hypothetical protein VE871_18585 [Longimicrobium sp.]|nr:hypothetical protein [Longimicrobium sp.]
MLFLWLLLMGLTYWLSPRDAPLTWIICLTGNILGIPLGMMASPLEREGTHFRAIGGWIASFASGYLLSKLEQFDPSPMLKDEISIGRSLAFVAFLILGAIQTFVLRSYLDSERARDFYLVPEDKDAAQPVEASA